MPPLKYPITPEMHEAIRQVYQTATGKGQVKALAQRFGYPREIVTFYAQKQGWIARHGWGKEPPWSEKELLILRVNAHLHPRRIQMRLTKAGFSRTLSAIKTKRDRLDLYTEHGRMSIDQVALAFGVFHQTVKRWVKQGFLKAIATGSFVGGICPGEIFLVADKAIRDFILAYPNLVDLRKVNKEWFIDILAGREDGQATWYRAVNQDSCGRRGEVEVGAY